VFNIVASKNVTWSEPGANEENVLDLRTLVARCPGTINLFRFDKIPADLRHFHDRELAAVVGRRFGSCFLQWDGEVKVVESSTPNGHNIQIVVHDDKLVAVSKSETLDDVTRRLHLSGAVTVIEVDAKVDLRHSGWIVKQIVVVSMTVETTSQSKRTTSSQRPVRPRGGRSSRRAGPRMV